MHRKKANDQMTLSPTPGVGGLQDRGCVREVQQLINTQQILGIVGWFASLWHYCRVMETLRSGGEVTSLEV